MGAVIRTNPGALAGQLKRRNAATLRAIARGALRGAHRGRAIIVRETPVDQGQLKAAWKVTAGDPSLLAGKSTLRSRLASVVLAELGNSAPHAGIVELGARPHGVSAEGMQAIADWVMRNVDLGTVAGPVQRGSGGRRKFQRDARERLAMAVAQSIAWKLRKYGQAPTYFVKSSRPLLEGVVQAEVEKGIGEVSRRGGGSNSGGA